MSNVTIQGLTKRFGGRSAEAAVDALDLEVEQGELLVLLGPSGCGKTTTLRCLAGLETADEGSIAFGDRVVFDSRTRTEVAPHKRNVGMVFQSYALWPHMTVRRNIGYPLRARRVAKATQREWIEEIAKTVDCSALLDRYPSQLSGGQQQRVALCRGLVARPELVLFDEPLSSLDARLRDSVRTEIHELQRRLGFTAVYVTHDQSEALALGDRLAIMRKGRLEQLATPEHVFERPASEYVAEFIGMANRIELRRTADGWAHEGVAVDVRGPVTAGEAVAIRLRPEAVRVLPPGEAPPGFMTLPGTIADAQFGGLHMDIVVEVAGRRLHSRSPLERGGWLRRVQPGEQVLAGFALADATCFDTSGAYLDASLEGGRRSAPARS